MLSLGMGAWLGCDPGAFHCDSSADCAGMGGPGVCQPTALCSFPDPGCTSGQRYGEHSGSMAWECVGEDADGNDSEHDSDSLPTGGTEGLDDGMVSDSEGSGDASGTAADPQGTMGQPCPMSGSCDPGEVCCDAEQCLDTCAVPCAEGACPAGTVCEHGYCLLECSNDSDCDPWPGFTCQHTQTACENDEA